MTPEVEEFLRALVFEVRDSTIVECDVHFYPESKSQSALAWKSYVNEGFSEHAFKEVIAEIVDMTIYNFLRSIDDEVMPLTFHASSGKDVNLRAATWGGELAVQYLGHDGMLAKYAEQRLSDYGKG